MYEPVTRRTVSTTRVHGGIDHRRYESSNLGPTLILIVASVYFVLPLWWLLVSATKSSGALFATSGFWFGPHVDVVANVKATFSYEGGVFARWLANSFIYAGAGAVAGTLFATLTGYALAKYRFHGQSIIFGVVLGGVLVPPIVLALPLYLMFSAVHLTNTYWSVLLPGIVNPFGVYLSRIYAARSVPDELLDAARVDGAREGRIFWTVALRIMTPALITIFMFQFVAVWNNFFLPLIMLDNPKLFPIVLGLENWNQAAQYAGAPPFLYAAVVTGSLVSVLPLMIGFFILQRYLRSGITLGALKG